MDIDGAMLLLDGTHGLIAPGTSNRRLPSLVTRAFVASLFYFLLSPCLPLGVGAIEAADEIGGRGRVINDTATFEQGLLLACLLLLQEVVRRRDLIVPVGFDALDRIIGVIIELVEEKLVHLVIDRHWLLTREEPPRVTVSLRLEPGMFADLLDTVALIRICAKNF